MEMLWRRFTINTKLDCALLLDLKVSTARQNVSTSQNALASISRGPGKAAWPETGHLVPKLGLRHRRKRLFLYVGLNPAPGRKHNEIQQAIRVEVLGDDIDWLGAGRGQTRGVRRDPAFSVPLK